MAAKIRAVEDEPATLRLVSHPVESAGYPVIPAIDRVEAQRKARQDAPD
jgi:CheY-like chemotaxis protein